MGNMNHGKETFLELRNLVVKLKKENKSHGKITEIIRKSHSDVQDIKKL